MFSDVLTLSPESAESWLAECEEGEEVNLSGVTGKVFTKSDGGLAIAITGIGSKEDEEPEEAEAESLVEAKPAAKAIMGRKAKVEEY